MKVWRRKDRYIQRGWYEEEEGGQMRGRGYIYIERETDVEMERVVYLGIRWHIKRKRDMNIDAR